MKRSKFLILFIISIIFFFGSFIIYQEYILNNGEEVILKTAPRDPRDILRGDYVVLRYQIGSGRKASEIIKNKNFRDNQEVYVILEKKDNKYADLLDIVTEKPDGNVLYLKGKIVNNWGKRVQFSNLEQYFVPEGKGRSIERMRDLEVLVSIRDGKAVIKKLLQNGGEINIKDIKKQGKGLHF